MKCDEIQSLQGPHQDSELDARTTLEIERHLKTCPACATLYAEAAQLDARVTRVLNEGSRTPALWERIENSVAAAAITPVEPARTSCARSTQVWAGVAAAWVVIISLHFEARETGAAQVAGQATPPTAAMRIAWLQQQRLLAELADVAPSAPTDKPKPVPTSPRGERRTDIRSA